MAKDRDARLANPGTTRGFVARALQTVAVFSVRDVLATCAAAVRRQQDSQADNEIGRAYAIYAVKAQACLSWSGGRRKTEEAATWNPLGLH